MYFDFLQKNWSVITENYSRFAEIIRLNCESVRVTRFETGSIGGCGGFLALFTSSISIDKERLPLFKKLDIFSFPCVATDFERD